MCSFSNYLESNILDHVFGKSNYSVPDVYIGLLLEEPDEDGVSLSEPQCSSYTRAATNASCWDDATEGLMENVTNITFAMACQNWGTITHFALFDSKSGGNMLACSRLSPSKTINSGDITRFAAGDLIISLD